jgi:hypothetical protein
MKVYIVYANSGENSVVMNVCKDKVTALEKLDEYQALGSAIDLTYYAEEEEVI